MSKKIVIVGGVAGGASAAARMRRVDEQAEITLFEKGEYISFANCGLPYHIGEVISERDRLLVQTPEAMEARFNIKVEVLHEVISIDREKKEVQVKNLKNNKVFSESYDYLILSPGAEPIKPPLEGLDSPNVVTLRNIPDTDKIKGFVDDKSVQQAVVVGGGFIGLEMAENLHERGIKVSLVEMADQVMAPLDYEMAAQVHNHLRAKGVDLCLKDGISKVEQEAGQTRVVLQSGRKIAADLVVLAIGVRPSTHLAREAGLELGQTGGIRVNEYLETSDKSIYALGDVIEITDFVTGREALIPLAGPANKQGRIVADNIAGSKEKYKGTQGTAIAKVFDLAVGATGSNEKILKRAEIEYQVSYTNSNNHAGYYPGAVPMMIKLVFTPDEGKILGAQIVGHDGVDKRIDVIATAIRAGLTIYDLQELELAYAPPFGSAKDPVNMAAFAAGNILKGFVRPAQYYEIADLNENAVILDVREEIETQLGQIKGAINIPLNSLRDRLDELNRDQEIIVYCAVGLRGYIGCRILMQNGFKNVRNLAGGYKLYSIVQDDKNQANDASDHREASSAVTPEEEQLSAEKKAHQEIKRVSLDACGLQCPGPIMQVYKKIEELNGGDIVEVLATDPGFEKDIEAWCKNTGNRLLESGRENGKIKVVIQKGKAGLNLLQEKPNSGKKAKTMVVFSGDLDRAIASFIIANGAAAMGNEITLFFTFWGLNILRKDGPVKVKKGLMDKMFGSMMPRGSKKLPLSNMNMFGAGPKMIRKVMKDKGVDSLEELIGQARLNGIRFIACQMSMDVMGIKKEELIEGVEVGGVASFLGAADDSNMTLFI